METVRTQTVGNLLRKWCVRPRMSQLDLALEADISTRHLSFVKTGRAEPSREMIIHFAEQLAKYITGNCWFCAELFRAFARQRILKDR